jgi:hypothetical protein
LGQLNQLDQLRLCGLLHR